MEENSITFKILLLGDQNVGKTSFMLRYCDDGFDGETVCTVGVDSKIKTINKNNKEIKLKIYDTAGQERFRSIVKNYYKGADGILLLYDISNLRSFESITNWIKSLKDAINLEKISLVIIGNKCDVLQEERKVTEEMKRKLEEEIGMKIIETSAKNNINIEEAFDSLINKIIDIRFSNKLENNKTFKLEKEDLKKKKKPNCFLKKIKEKNNKNNN